MEDKIFKSDAKQIVDLAFDNKVLAKDLTRDNLNDFEELIEFLLRSRFESYKKAEKLFESISKH